MQTLITADAYPKRPTEKTAGVLEAAAAKLGAEVAKWAKDSDVEAVTKDVLKVLTDSWNRDGYSIARDLDRLGYEPDSDLVEILDDAYWAIESEVKRRQCEWVKEFGIKSPHEIGAKVAVNVHGLGMITGEVVRVDSDVARIVVQCVEAGHKPGCGWVFDAEKDIFEARK